MSTDRTDGEPGRPDVDTTAPGRGSGREARLRVFSALAWSALHSWGSSFFAFIVSIVLARLLLPEAFGLVALALVYIGLVRIFVEQGLASAVVQRSDLEPAHLDTAFWMSVGTSVVFVAGSVLAAGPIANLFGEPALTPILRWLSLVVLFSGLQSTQRAILQRRLAFEPLAKRTLTGNFLGGAAGIGAALAGWGVWSLVVQTVASQFVSTLLLWKVADWRPHLRFSVRHFRDLFGFSANIFGSNLLTFANRHVDDFLIGLVLGPVALGFYTVAYTMLRKMTTLLVSVITRVAFPAFSRVQDDPDRMRDGFYRATQVTALVTFPAFIGVLAVAPEFILSLYGDRWAATIPVLQWLALAGIHDAAFAFNGSVILAAGRSRWRLLLSAAYAGASVIAFLIAVEWGIVAVAAGFVISRYVMSPLPVLMLRRLVGVGVSGLLRQYRVAVSASLLMWAAIEAARYIMGDTLPIGVRLGILIATGAAVYTITVRLMRPALANRLIGLVRDARAARRSSLRSADNHAAS